MSKVKPKDKIPDPVQATEHRRLKLKAEFISALASFLSQDMSRKSIALELGLDWAKDWAKVRTAANVIGWLDEAETMKHLTELLR